MNSFVRSITRGVFESAPSPELRYSWAVLPALTIMSASFRSRGLSLSTCHIRASGPESRSPGITSKKLS